MAGGRPVAGPTAGRGDSGARRRGNVQHAAVDGRSARGAAGRRARRAAAGGRAWGAVAAGGAWRGVLHEREVGRLPGGSGGGRRAA